MFTLAHMSDIHLSPLPQPPKRQLIGKRLLGYLNWEKNRAMMHSREVLDLLVADLRQQQHDHIAVTGDLVNLSLPAEFIEAQHWLEELGTPDMVSVVPGNHDRYVRVKEDLGLGRWSAYMQCNEAGAAYKQDHASRFPYVRRFGKVAIVGLSSAHLMPWLISAGRLGKAQLRETGELLQRLGADGYVRIILIHHPPLEGSKMHHFRRGIHDVGPFRDMVRSAGAELILHGHHHTNTKVDLQTDQGPVPIIGVPSASVCQNPIKPVARYNLIELMEEGASIRCMLTGRGYNREENRFEQVERTEITLKQPEAA